MGINAAHICDLQSDQEIKGKKSFVKGIKIGTARGPCAEFKLEEKDKLRINCKSVRGAFEGSFDGDGSKLKNLPIKNLQADDIHTSNSFNVTDYFLIQKVLADKNNRELKKVKINDMFSLLPSQNGVLFDFINNGSNVGAGLHLLKGRKISGRSEVLEFRTLQHGPNFISEQTDNEITLKLNPDVSVKKLSIDNGLLVPRVNRKEVKSPEPGMIVYDTETNAFYGYIKDKWITLNRYTSHF